MLDNETVVALIGEHVKPFKYALTDLADGSMDHTHNITNEPLCKQIPTWDDKTLADFTLQIDVADDVFGYVGLDGETELTVNDVLELCNVACVARGIYPFYTLSD